MALLPHAAEDFKLFGSKYFFEIGLVFFSLLFHGFPVSLDCLCPCLFLIHKQNGKISGLFDVVRTAGEAGAGKPAPDVYLMVAAELKVEPERCLVFEDVPMGILAGKNAGMKVCAVEDAFSSLQRGKKKELADYYINDYYDISNETYEVLE